MKYIKSAIYISLFVGAISVSVAHSLPAPSKETLTVPQPITIKPPEQSKAANSIQEKTEKHINIAPPAINIGTHHNSNIRALATLATMAVILSSAPPRHRSYLSAPAIQNTPANTPSERQESKTARTPNK